jgi:hypothetical protein
LGVNHQMANCSYSLSSNWSAKRNQREWLQSCQSSISGSPSLDLKQYKDTPAHLTPEKSKETQRPCSNIEISWGVSWLQCSLSRSTEISPELQASPFLKHRCRRSGLLVSIELSTSTRSISTPCSVASEFSNLLNAWVSLILKLYDVLLFIWLINGINILLSK